MTKLVLLHLSDIHVRSKEDLVLARAADIAAAAFQAAAEAAHIFVVVSGDIAATGDADEYDAATLFLQQVLDLLRRESGCVVDAILIPGNHDCDFRQDDAARRQLIGVLVSGPYPEVDDSVIDICTRVQAPFLGFRQSLESEPPVYDDRLWQTHLFAVGTRQIAFECLNLSWLSQRAESPGTLFFPTDRYQRMPMQDADLRIAILHEPFHWLNQSTMRPLRTLIRRISDVVLTGHEHVGNVGSLDESASGRSVFVEGCVLQETPTDLRHSAFNVVEIDLEGSQFASTRYAWNGARYSACEEGSWTHYHELPGRPINEIPLEAAFVSMLDDPGGPIRHPARQQITLGDLFVYPDLLEMTDQPSKRSYRSSKFLANLESIGDGILLEGDEKSGRTSLLRHLFREYYEQGFYPVLLRGEQLNRQDERGVERAVAAAIHSQYGAGQSEALMQLERNKRIALVDDFDESKLRSRAGLAELLTHLRARFGHVLVAVDETFELGQAGPPGRNEFLGLDRFRIQPFGYHLRGRLIAKWHTLGVDGSVDESAMLTRCDHSERIINEVMKKTLIPASPLYLITLLQSIEAGRSGEFKDSALGYYYQFLLTESFGSCGVKADKLTEFFQYCAHLAWFFHTHGGDAPSESDLRSFNRAFSEEWHSVDFTPRLETLIAARILSREGDSYRFRYHYVYYYLKGKYLSERLGDSDARHYVKHCCEHLYVRDHAHTILFLTHHTNDPFVISSIQSALQSLFREVAPLGFSGDTERIAKLINEAPQLKYLGGRPEDHREQRDVLRDRLEERTTDPLRDEEEPESVLSLAAQLTSLMKTTEILGLVLKNQYSRISRKRKVELLDEVFSAPLRALHRCYLALEENPEALVAAVEGALERLEQARDTETRRRVARRVVASVILLIGYAFVARAAGSANSESLLEDVEQVVGAKDTVAFRLIDAAIALDSPRPFARRKLKTLVKMARAEPLAGRILQLIVLNRLYMFRTTEDDLQWLSTEIDLELGEIHKIAHSPQSTRRLKQK